MKIKSLHEPYLYESNEHGLISIYRMKIVKHLAILTTLNTMENKKKV